MRRRSLLGVLGAALLGAGAWECGPEAPQKQDPNDPKPPPPARADSDAMIGGTQIRAAKISLWVEPTAWPVSISVDVENHTSGQKITLTGDQWGKSVTVHGPGQWTVPLSYPAGDRVEVTIKADGVHPSPKGYVAWRDGREGRYARSSAFNGGTHAGFTVWTQR